MRQFISCREVNFQFRWCKYFKNVVCTVSLIRLISQFLKGLRPLGDPRLWTLIYCVNMTVDKFVFPHSQRKLLQGINSEPILLYECYLHEYLLYQCDCRTWKPTIDFNPNLRMIHLGAVILMSGINRSVCVCFWQKRVAYCWESTCRWLEMGLFLTLFQKNIHFEPLSLCS